MAVGTASASYQHPRLHYSGVRVTVEPTADGVIDVRDYGADDTGTDDSTAAINAAVDAAKAQGKFLVGYGGTFKVLGTVNLKTSCDFAGSTFEGVADGAGVPMVRIADDDVFLKRLFHLWIRLPRLEKPKANIVADNAATWPTDDEGVRIEGLSRSYVMYDFIGWFRIGVRVMSTTETVTGAGFNTHQLSTINGCKRGVWIDVRARESADGDSFGGGGTDGGFVNENTFIGGAVRSDGMPVGVSTPTADVYQLYLSGFYNGGSDIGTPQHNVFWRTGLEGNLHEYSIWCEGDRNKFLDLRWERFSPSLPTEKIMIARPAGVGTDIPWWAGQRNVFSGLNMDRLTDSTDDYGHFELGNDMEHAVADNWAWDVDHIGRATDEGGGWVKVVDGSA